MEEWMEKYFGKPKEKKRTNREKSMWPFYIAAVLFLLTLQSCLSNNTYNF